MAHIAKSLIFRGWRGTPAACAALPPNVLFLLTKCRAVRGTLLLRNIPRLAGGVQ